MRQLWAGLLGLALLAPALRADDKPKAEKAAATAKTPQEQYEELVQAFQKEMTDLQKQFQEAKTPQEKAKIRDKALKDVSVGYAQKALALAKAHPKDPVAEDALVFVCSLPGESPLAPQALDLFLRNHAGSDKLLPVLQRLAGRNDGEAILRRVHTDKSAGKAAQLQAGFFLADILREKDEPTAEQTQEAEALLAAVIDQAKHVKGVPDRLVKQAEANLTAIRKFSIGKTAPDAQSTDLDGKAVKLSDYKGKVVVLDFWATWCGPCRGMIPHEREMVKKNAGKPFVFVSVSADDKKETLKEFIEKEPMPWVHWWSGAEGGVVREWNIQAYPTIFVIDAKGVIRGKIVGGGDDNEKRLDALVEKLVREASPASE
jgi:thiol-disulfide isomerase/thioredoxin